MSNNENINSSIKELSPYILLQPYRNTITISKDIIKSLGYPKHVCLRINETTNSFAILPCKPEDALSFKVPEKLFIDHHCVFRLTSKQFMLNLIFKHNLDITHVYGCNGIFSQKINAIIVNLNEDNLQVKNIITIPENA